MNLPDIIIVKSTHLFNYYAGTLALPPSGRCSRPQNKQCQTVALRYQQQCHPHVGLENAG
jgi:hypothetical protein